MSDYIHDKKACSDALANDSRCPRIDRRLSFCEKKEISNGENITIKQCTHYKQSDRETLDHSNRSNRIDDFAISIYLLKRLPLEMIQHIMHSLPFKYSETVSEGFPGTSALNPYRLVIDTDSARIPVDYINQMMEQGV